MAPKKKAPLALDDPRHGSLYGYRVHLEQGVPVCDACRQANAAYSREQQRKPRVRKLTNERSKARNAARTRLVQAHRAEYQQYYREALGNVRGLNKS